MPARYSILRVQDPQYKRILLEAKGLRTSLQNYKQDLPLDSPTIYVSTTPKELPIVIDTGASCSVTPNLNDYITTPTKPDVSHMEGLNGNTTEVLGSGPIRWDIEDAHGIRDTLETNAYFMPKANIRLFSPQVYILEQHRKQNTHCNLNLDANGISLTLANGTILKFPIQQGSNLPIMLTHQALQAKPHNRHQAPHDRKLNRFGNLATFLCSRTFHIFNEGALFHLTADPAKPNIISDSGAVLHRSNWNISPAQQELLLWHSRLGHVNLDQVQTLLAKPRQSDLKRIIEPSNNKSSHCPKPLCEACQYAKQKRRNPPSKHAKPRKELEGALSRDIVIPGQRVSVDLYQSAVKGRLSYTFGKEKTDHQYTGGAIFVDHATRIIHHTHQFSTTASETVNSKHKFKHYCDNQGVKIKEYVGDNNPFHSSEWKMDCANQNQTCSLSGVGAHHQNYAERNIQTIFNMARAMLLHFAVHWPQEAKANLWPFAVDHAIYVWNNLPNSKTRISPFEHFTGTSATNHHHLQRLHVFGCPVYVLDPKLQDGKKLPKWSRRSRRGIYLGISRIHSTTVHLVLNPDTGHISPQYHVIFDDTFATVFSDGAFTDNVWNSLLVSNIERHPDADSAADIIPFTPISSTLGDDSNERETPRVHFPEEPDDANSLSPTPTIPTVDDPAPSPEPSSPPEGANPLAPEGATPSAPEGAPPSAPKGDSDISPSKPASPKAILRRSTRTRNPVDRLTLYANRMFDRLPKLSGSRQIAFNQTDNLPRVPRERINQQFLATISWDRLTTLCGNTTGTLAAFISEHKKNSSYSSLVEYLNPALFITMANKEDNPTYKEAMVSPDAAGFMKAMELEIRTLLELDVFDIVPRPLQKVISGVWAFKRKRYPDGSIRKLKARYCARGFEQKQGVDYFETFAPVVMWLTVRLLLIMSILMDLETKQIDYTAAFVHAPIDCVVFVDMPKGFELPGMVWKLKKSLYGLAQSPRNFFLHTKNQLTQKLGFTQSEADPCLFISDDVICLIYVDDALLFYKDSAAVDRLTTKMTKEHIQFREEEDVAGYLGVHIDRKDDGTIHLTQKGLTERIVSALHLDDSSIEPTPTPCTGYLAINEHGESAHETFSYPSVVGQLNYLSGHSRCDITMATSQVARFIHSPKRSHELALIRIGRYLKGTLDKGLILKPNPDRTLNIDLFVDAAFACGWGSEEGTNPEAVKSRTGYIIEIADCPVMWVSKLQSTVATSTMESEYTALSMALRAFIPLHAVVKSVVHGLRYQNPERIQIKATVHEDNQGALILAKLEPGRHTVRSKFYAIRLHWFRSWIQAHEIEIIFVETALQKADFLTKALSPTIYERNRFLSMGW